MRLDECHHRVEPRANGSDDIDSAGWEVPDPEILQRIAQQLEDGGVKVVAGTRDEADHRRVIDLGCHMNDRMVSFYLGNPSGFALEYGWGARMIDDAAWQAEPCTSMESLWGHPQLRDLVAGMAPPAK